MNSSDDTVIYDKSQGPSQQETSNKLDTMTNFDKSTGNIYIKINTLLIFLIHLNNFHSVALKFTQIIFLKTNSSKTIVVVVGSNLFNLC